MLPQSTRLRWVSAKAPETLEKFCNALGKRIEIKSINRVGSEWFLWFVPDDKKSDIKSGKIKEKGA